MKSILASVVLLTMSLALPAYAGEVKLQLANGRITLQARDATVREILAEWSRVGQVKIVNGEKISGAPLTLDLQGVPEARALNTLLRSVCGYMAATRPQAGPAGSMYDRIVILATPRTLSASTSYTTTGQQQQPQAQFRQSMPPGMANPTMQDDDEQGGPPPTYPGGPPGYPGLAQRGMMTPPQMQQPGTPGMQASPAGAVPQGAPGTVSPMPQVQGMPGQPTLIVQPGTGAPGTVTPPVKKPGGPGGTGPGGEPDR